MNKTEKSVLQHYWLAIVLTVLVFGVVVFHNGLSSLLAVAVLAIIEVTFSFDNAVLNSEVLSRMAKAWRVVFLTVGIAIAVFGVRLILPVVIVSASAGEGVRAVLDMALKHPAEYEHHLLQAYPLIAAFGGTFLLMIGLRFLAEERDHKWLKKVETPVAGIGHPWLVSLAGAAVALVSLFLVLRPGEKGVAFASLLGAATFVIIKGISVSMESMESDKELHKRKSSGWMNFLYLEILDASFSFDGVIAAFAITKNVVLIAAGLGIGAIYVRSITVHLLERGTLAEYRYLVHGAHYAIAVLGVILIAGTRFEIPDFITGLTGMGIIGWSLYNSVQHNRRERTA